MSLYFGNESEFKFIPSQISLWQIWGKVNWFDPMIQSKTRTLRAWSAGDLVWQIAMKAGGVTLVKQLCINSNSLHVMY